MVKQENLDGAADQALPTSALASLPSMQNRPTRRTRSQAAAAFPSDRVRRGGRAASKHLPAPQTLSQFRQLPPPPPVPTIPVLPLGLFPSERHSLSDRLRREVQSVPDFQQNQPSLSLQRHTCDGSPVKTSEPQCGPAERYNDQGSLKSLPAAQNTGQGRGKTAQLGPMTITNAMSQPASSARKSHKASVADAEDDGENFYSEDDFDSGGGVNLNQSMRTSPARQKGGRKIPVKASPSSTAQESPRTMLRCGNANNQAAAIENDQGPVNHGFDALGHLLVGPEWHEYEARHLARRRIANPRKNGRRRDAPQNSPASRGPAQAASRLANIGATGRPVNQQNNNRAVVPVQQGRSPPRNSRRRRRSSSAQPVDVRNDRSRAGERSIRRRLDDDHGYILELSRQMRSMELSTLRNQALAFARDEPGITEHGNLAMVVLFQNQDVFRDYVNMVNLRLLSSRETREWLMEKVRLCRNGGICIDLDDIFEEDEY